MSSIKVLFLANITLVTNGTVSTIVYIYSFNVNSLSSSYFMHSSSLLMDRREGGGEEKVPISKRSRYALKYTSNHPVSIADVDEELSNSTHVVSMYFLQGPTIVAYEYIDNLFLS